MNTFGNDFHDDVYDAIIVGTGLGGLSAALKLASGGARILLLERHNLPGGFATSFVRGRFEFEVSLHELSDIGSPDNKGAVRRYLEDELGMDVEFMPVPEAYHLILEKEGINVKLPFGTENFISAIEAVEPGSHRAVEDLLADCRQVSRALSYLGSLKGPPDINLLYSEYPAFVSTAAYTVDDVIDRYELSPRVRQMIYPYWCYLGVPTDRLSFTIFAVMLYSYLSKGAYIPKLTSHGLSTAMEMKFRELGGTILYNTEVDKILVEGGRTVGVETCRGEKFKAPFVIANLSPHLVYGKMIYPQNAVPEAALKNSAARRLGTSAVVLYLGLDRSPQELNLNSYGYFIGPSMNTKTAYENFFSIEPQDMQAVICLNNANPDCSPPGTTILSSTMLVGPDVWSEVQPDQYYRIKSELAAGIIEKMSGYLGISLADHIEEIEIATPQTFSRYTGAYRGVMYGYEQDPWDSVVARSISASAESYIKGLEFAGGFSSMGHGYAPSIISGRGAAIKVLRKLDKLYSGDRPAEGKGGSQ
ncbi:MAG: NAD(P)/FAD-dependent oxidoreductase [Bacillota bacterium]|nr:NAD(P)/FAD-dependent oxidoreductase [Bacillota bacterium]